MTYNKAIFLGGLIISIVGVIGNWFVIPQSPTLGTLFVIGFGIIGTLNFLELRRKND